MSDDSTDIVDHKSTPWEEFQKLEAFVQSAEARKQTVAEVELTLFRSLLALGAALLRLYFTTRAQVPEPEPVRSADGEELAFHGWRPVSYFSVFGKLTFRRRYYYRQGQGGCCPLDAALALPARCYSQVLTDWLEFAVTEEAYAQSVELVKRILGLEVAKHALERLVGQDAGDVEAFYAQKPAPAHETEAEILVVQVDGKGVRMLKDATPGEAEGPRRTEKKQAIVTAVYTIAPYFRSAEAIADSLAGKPVETMFVGPKAARPEPIGKEVRASLDGKDAAFDRLAARAHGRDGSHIRHRVALTDGEQALHDRVRTYLPDFELVLDLVHVKDYVHAAAVAILGEAYPYLRDFVSCRLEEILTGRLDRAISMIEAAAQSEPLSKSQRETVHDTLRYLRNHADIMHYDRYLALGWPIATGVIEGACRHVVKDRMERAGMRWTRPGARAILQLRVVCLNDDWESYQVFHRQSAFHRLYGDQAIPSDPAEVQSLAQAA